MKKYLFLILAASLAFVSCGDEKEEVAKEVVFPEIPDDIDWEKVNEQVKMNQIWEYQMFMGDGSCYQNWKGGCFDRGDGYGFFPRSDKDIDTTSNMVNNYADSYFFLTYYGEVDAEDKECKKEYDSYSREQQMEFWELRKSYLIELGDCVFKDYCKYDNAIWSVFVSAYVDGEFCVTSDKVLFGEEPGTNLSRHFRLTGGRPCQHPVGIERPYMLYGLYEEMPIRLDEYFVNETWLVSYYFFEFADEPEERYDEVTYTFSMPVKDEHVFFNVFSQYKGENKPKKYTQHVLNKSVTVKYKWK